MPSLCLLMADDCDLLKMEYCLEVDLFFSYFSRYLSLSSYFFSSILDCVSISSLSDSDKFSVNALWLYLLESDNK